MKINIHAGHCPDGKGACGAVGLIKESTEARKVKDLVIKYLKTYGHTVYDCTCETNETQNGCLKKIVSKCNDHKVDLDVSIHFNSGAKDKKGNKKTTGTEVYIYTLSNKAKTYAQRTVKAISSLGFKNRGVKRSISLYVLRKTKSPSMLIECCFVDDKDDIDLYNSDKMAKAIVKGITNQAVILTSKKGYTGTFPKGTLRKGNKGTQVKYLQKFLYWYGYKLGIDGSFGSKTEKAVKAFQKANGLTADGVFGSKSLSKAKSVKK
jgi:N-acetylmuramoyl-L-alanine amidase